MSQKVAVEVDTKTFVRFWLVILGFGLVALFVWKALTGLIIVGIAAFLAIAIRPLAKRIDRIDQKKARPGLSSVVAFLSVVLVLGIVVGTVGPVVVNETAKFVGQIPEMFEQTLGGWDGINNFGKTLGIDDFQGQIYTALKDFSSAFVANFGNTVVTSVSAIAGGVTEVILTLVLTLLFLLEGPALLDSFWTALEGKRRDESIETARRVVGRMMNVIATYVSKQMTVAIIDGAVVTLAVFVLSLIFGFSAGLAFPMGLICMALYLIPMFGQIISCAIVTLVLLFNAPLAGVVFLAFYLLYSQIENNGIAPKIQGDALSLPPLIILAAITIGMYMFGFVGAIIAIPVAGCIKVLVEEYPNIAK